jgi:hypothetical protein
VKTYTHDDWVAEAKKRFGDDLKKWQFVCPQCKTVQTIQDFIDADVEKETISRVIAFSCIGRFTEDKGCDWTLGGLFRIHKVEIIMESGENHPAFEFSDAES